MKIYFFLKESGWCNEMIGREQAKERICQFNPKKELQAKRVKVQVCTYISHPVRQKGNDILFAADIRDGSYIIFYNLLKVLSQ